jgi:hypothetical protein
MATTNGNGRQMIDLSTLAAKLGPAAIVTSIAVYMIVQREQDWRAAKAEIAEIRKVHLERTDKLEKVFRETLSEIKKHDAEETALTRKMLQDLLGKKEP